MKNTFGSSVTVTLFGESHGPEIGAVLDGLAPGIPVEEDYIAAQLALRRPADALSTARREPDAFRVISGVYRGVTTGTPLCILVPNADVRSEDYPETERLARPGHADYTAHVKYHGYEDFRGGGHGSGRLTAALTAVGAVALTALRGKGIAVGTHILRCGGVNDAAFTDPAAEIAALDRKAFAVLDEERGAEMCRRIAAAAAAGDSVGGQLETAVCGLPAGVGEPWFDTVEGVLSHALFAVPGIKGVTFGDAAALVDAPGSVYNDALRMRDGVVTALTNHNGGVSGGITDGMPLRFTCLVRPTPSVFVEQQTVDLLRGEDAVLRLQGRHDPAILHRTRVVVDSVTALTLCDLLAQRFGTDWLCP